MKSIKFKVELTFNDDIDIKSVEEIGLNIKDALYNQANGMGLAPVDSNTWTTKIDVSYGNWHWIKE